MYLKFWKLLKSSRKKGMVFKPSFKSFKNEKINLSQAFLKLETLLFQNMFLLFIIFYIDRAISTQAKKKSGLTV